MKLTINRREEERKKLFKTVTWYILEFHLEATPEETALIKKHKWDTTPLCVAMHQGGTEMSWNVGNVLGEKKSWAFDTVETLAYAENQIIENAKKLKGQLAAAASFTSGGPREVEL